MNGPVCGPLRVAVVGAGLAGLTAARRLQDAGHTVKVFDKGRSPAGRMATRREGDLRFDHGAQYFTARDGLFRREVEDWVAAGVAAEWKGRVGTLSAGEVRPGSGQTTRFVGTPGMSAPARRLAERLQVHSGVTVAALELEGEEWTVGTLDGKLPDRFEVALVTVPAPQAAPLLQVVPRLAAKAREARLQPCWAVLAAFEHRLETSLDGAFVEHPVLRWAARQSSRPGRPADEAWVLHATSGWSESHLGDEPGEVEASLLSAFADALAQTLPVPIFAWAHRWRFALPDPPLGSPCLFDDRARLGAGGDWCGGPRVEGAFLSGRALAERVLGRPLRAG